MKEELTKKEFETAEKKMNNLLAVATIKGALNFLQRKKVQSLKNSRKL